jgi:beta-glucosidase
MARYSERVQALLRELTLEEKVSLLAGASFWYTTPVERLGIPAIKVSDGPNGARGDVFGAGKTAACFPAGISLAATWNTTLVEQIGQALAEEAQSKGAVVLLGPTVNIHRSPLNGRNFESFSEDPYLTGRMAVSYIKGLQSRGVGASVKHYAGNNSEFERNTINSEIGERALREIYLPAFEAAASEADSWTVMAAYNKLNGAFCTENHELLISILKDEWGWNGLVVSDWFATHSTAAAANAGLDLEMPGPPAWRGEKLVKAVQAGEVSEAAIDDEAARVLYLIERSGAFEHPEIAAEQSNDRPAHRSLIRRAAAEGVVLLQNNLGVLPLDPRQLQRLAIIGPNAKIAQIMGGGSAQVNAHYAVTPFEGLAAQLGPNVKVEYAIGCSNYKFVPLVRMDQVAPAAGQASGAFAVAFYNTLDLSSEPVLQATLPGAEPSWFGEVGPAVNPRAFSARISGLFTPHESGPYVFSLLSAGLSRLNVDGKQLIDQWTAQNPGDAFFGAGSAEKTAEIRLTAGQPVEIVVEYSSQGAAMMRGLRLGAMLVVPQDAIARAAELAAASDAALVFVGSSGEWESEGFDRPNIDLAGQQVALIEAVAAANPRTVVVLQTGSPVAMPWLDKPAAVLQAWFCGQECGNAIADVLFGAVDASGRLPQTFPIRLEDNPAYINYPGENGTVVYGEGIFVGYRYYDKKRIDTLFPFGFGLSYTSFDYSNLRLSKGSLAPDQILEVSLDVTNTGQRHGMEVVQLYVRDPASALARPEKELKGFAKLELQPGETKTVSFTLDRRSLAFYDDALRRWVAEAGEFTVLVGRSAADIRLESSFQLNQSARFDGPGRPRARLSIDSTLRELLADEQARAIVERHVPGFFNKAQPSFTHGFTLRQLTSTDTQTFNDQVLGSIANDLEQAG